MAERNEEAAELALPTQKSSSPPVVRWIRVEDIREALRLGVADFRAVPTHGVLFGLVYAVLGLVLVRVAFDASLWPMMFPLVAGFALLGPFVALGLYELSRRREQGLATRWWHIFGVRRHLALGPILALGAVLALIFGFWLWTASALYAGLLGTPPATPGAFLGEVFTTSAGWTLILVGHAVGFVFALAAFMISVVSFPLLVDRDVGLADAVTTSIRAVVANPLPMGLWAVILAAGLILGSAPLLLGLPVVLPIFGHASWHVYRRVVLP